MNPHKKTILVVEDESLLLQAIVKKLEMHGIEAVSAVSGEQALDYLKSLPELPDAIWLDYYLEDMNGLEFMKAIQDHPDWKQIPIVVVSNSASEEKINSMLALGAKKYLLKAEYRLDDIVNLFDTFIDDNKKDVAADMADSTEEGTTHESADS